MDHPTRRGFVCSVGSVSLLGMPSAQAQASLEVLVSGTGPRVILVHGSVSNGPLTWAEQQPLAERFRLEVINRRGYGKSPPPASRQDFDEDAQDIAALLGDGAHLSATPMGHLAR
jgi:pimeloyl-ACP methyl ester carboxylesterase